MKPETKAHQQDPYKVSPPEGGWGYVIAAAVALSCSVTVAPMICFGQVYGNFLSTIGDETTGTTLSNAIMNTVFNFTGLAANSLLQRYSFRFVGMVGACIFFIGAFSTIFATTLMQLIISFGVIQGFGIGLLFPSVFTALNSYFDKKLTLMNNIAQALMVMISIVYPVVVKFLMETYGFRGTVAMLAAISLNGILAAFVLQPVEWHLRKNPILKLIRMDSNYEENQEKNEPHRKPLIEIKVEESEPEKYISHKPRASIISMGDRAVSVMTINRMESGKGVWQTLVDSLDLGMFKDPCYVNLTVGLSLGFNADVALITIIPLLLAKAGFNTSEIAFMITVHFASDLVGRVILSVMAALFKLNNRFIFMGSAILTTIVRTAFVFRDDFFWKLISISILGFLRCFIQSPLTMVISDKYSNNFSTAFSLYMVVCGFISLVLGVLMSLIKSWTNSDIMVVHLLSMAYLVSVVAWLVEMLSLKVKKTNNNDTR